MTRSMIVLAAAAAVAVLGAKGAPAAAQDQPAQDAPAAAASGAPAEAAVWAPVPAEGLTLDQFVWKNRLVLVFADSASDQAFVEQMRLLALLPADLVARDVVVITDTDPAAASAIRLRLRPRGFMFALVDKDGSIMTRKPRPMDVREISRSIDKTPIRRKELEVQRLGR